MESVAQRAIALIEKRGAMFSYLDRVLGNAGA